jgi:hypothetical protein
MRKITKTLIFVSAALCLILAGVFLYRTCNVTLVQEEVDLLVKRDTAPAQKTRPAVKLSETDLEIEKETIQVPEQVPEYPEVIEEEVVLETKPVNKDQPAENKESSTIFIPLTKSLFNHKDLSISNLPKGKVYYNGANGRLESNIIASENNRMTERLTSYNTRGEKIDHLDIGLITENAEKRKYAVISQNTISVFDFAPENTREESVTYYSITPELRFIKGKTYKKVK